MADFKAQKKNGGKDVQQYEAALPVLTVGGCKVCTSPYRASIDSMVARGMTNRAIREAMEEAVPGIGMSQSSLQRHITKHLDLAKQATRKVIEYEAKQAFDLIDEHSDYLLTNKAALKIIRQKGFEAVMEGRAKISVQDLLMVIDKIEQMDQAESVIAIDEMQREFQALIRTVKLLIPEERHGEIAEVFDRELAKTNDTATMLVEYGKNKEVTDVTVITEDSE